MKSNTKLFARTANRGGLQNLCCYTDAEINNAAEAAQDAQDLANRLNQLRNARPLQLYRETETKIVLRHTDSFGNNGYLEFMK